MKGKKCNVIGGKGMKNRWIRMAVCLGVVISFFVFGVPTVLSANSLNYPTANTYSEDSYYEDYKEESYNKDTYYNEYYKDYYEDAYDKDTYYENYYYKDNDYKGSYYNDYYKDYSYRPYKYSVYYYLRTLFERFPRLENILANFFRLN